MQRRLEQWVSVEDLTSPFKLAELENKICLMTKEKEEDSIQVNGPPALAIPENGSPHLSNVEKA